MTVPRIGVVGAGALGYHHVRILRDLDGIEFVGFYDVDVDRSAKVTKELGVQVLRERSVAIV